MFIELDCAELIMYYADRPPYYAPHDLIFVGHGGSFTAEVRRVLFDVRIRWYQYSFNVYHHSLGTPVGGQFSYVY